jgi:hypothetical protein
MQFERGKPPETPNAPYRAARIKDDRRRLAGAGFEPGRVGPRLSLTSSPFRQITRCGCLNTSFAGTHNLPHYLLGDGHDVCAFRYQLRVCPDSMQDRPFTCECGKPFSPGQTVRCICCAGVRTACHDVAVDCSWRGCVERYAQVSIREPADAHLHGNADLGPALVNGKREDSHVFDTSWSVRCDVFIVDPTFPSYSGKSNLFCFVKLSRLRIGSIC